MEEKNETVTENKSEKKEVVYTKNEKYGQDEINKLVKIYHMAQKAGDEVTVQDAYTKLYYHIEKYVYKTLWDNYGTLMRNNHHRDDIIQDVWGKNPDRAEKLRPGQGCYYNVYRAMD